MTKLSEKQTQLGVGLIGIGRSWGYKETPIPTEEKALNYISHAYLQGITFFDTAPAYGSSEIRLGKFLASLSDEERGKITVATKFGEHWNEEKNEPYTDHSFTALKTSIDQSITRLGKIDLLQVHKTTHDVLQSSDLREAIVYAKSKGIKEFGASVSDLESAEMVCENEIFSNIQFPYNENNQLFSEIIAKARQQGKLVIINRPFNMGGTLYEKDDNTNPEEQRKNAYKFILRKIPTNGIILTGTKSNSHLDQNLKAFKKVGN